MTTNFELQDLADKMRIPNLKQICYKDELTKVEPNSSYIINLQHSKSEGNGTHFTALVCDKEGKCMYMDSYGENAPKAIMKLLKKRKWGYTTKVIQGNTTNLCGFFCLAFIYFLTIYKQRTKEIAQDANLFMALFEDLENTNEWYKNEHILSLFFIDYDTKKTIIKNNNIGMTEDNRLQKDFNIEEKKLRR